MIKTYQYHSKGFDCQVQISYKDGVLSAVEIFGDPDAEVLPSQGEGDAPKAVFFIYEYGFLNATKNNKSLIEIKREITFDMFWDRYAQKVGKAEAQKAWNQLSKKDQQEAYDYIPAYESFRKSAQHAKLLPASYLHKKRWIR